MGTLLIFGLDPHLLQTRRILLQSAGFEVIAVGKLEQLQTLDAPIQLLVLCHTLSTNDCEQALSIAATRWPNAKELVLTPLGGISRCATQHEDHFSVSQGPASLIARIRELLPVSPAFAAPANGKTSPLHPID